MITEKYTQQIWILLAESFSSVVSDLSQPLWFVLKLIFCRLVLDAQSSRNPLIVFFLPFITTFPLQRTSTFNPHLPNTISHPALHSRTIDNSECLIPSMTCAYLAPGGSPGMSKAPPCVLYTCSPFATVTTMGFVVFLVCINSHLVNAPYMAQSIFGPRPLFQRRL